MQTVMRMIVIGAGFVGVVGVMAPQTTGVQATGVQATTAQSTGAPRTKVVFLAGPKDHGRPGNGRHEYEKDARLLAKALETSPNLTGIQTEVYVGKAPRDLSALQDASVFVIESSSDRDAKETHPLFPQDPSTDGRTYGPDDVAYLKAFDTLVKKGAGVVVFHYANWTEHPVARRYYIQWAGALWVDMLSTNPVDQWAMALKNEDHPIQRGVKPWSYRDEIFCRFFLPVDPRRTELLIATPGKVPIGPQVASWAYDRADGGRGFFMGGVDFHDNLSTVEDFRRFLLNGIVWAAGRDVPEGGVQSTVPPVEAGSTAGPREAAKPGATPSANPAGNPSANPAVKPPLR